MSQQVFNVTEGQPLNQSFGFVANAVTINNLTQSWCYVSAAQQFIPPYQYGVVIPLPGADIADIVWQTPTSLPVGPVGTGTLSATYTDAKLVPSNGVSVFTQQTTVALKPTVSQAGGSVFYTLPGGCQAVLLIGTSGGPFIASVFGTTTNKYYANAFTAQGGGLIVPVAPAVDPVVQIAISTGGVTVQVIALFTSQPEPVTAVAISGTAAENLTQIAGNPVSNTVPGTLDVNIKDVNGSAVPGAAGMFPVDLQRLAGAVLAPAVAGSLDINIKDVGGSPTGVLSVNLADLNGSASVVGQQAMAASFPVVIASDQSALPANLTQIKGVALSTQMAGVQDVELRGIGSPASPPLSPAGLQYLQVIPRPTISVAAVSAKAVTNAGVVLIAAPGIGSSIVLRRIELAASVAPAAVTGLTFGTTLTGSQLGAWVLDVAAAGAIDNFALDFQDFLVGDNLPVDMSASTVAGSTFWGKITYSVVATANWPGA